MYISNAAKQAVLRRNLSCLPNGPGNHRKWSSPELKITQAFHYNLLTQIRKKPLPYRTKIQKKIIHTICQALSYGGGYCLEFNLVGLFLWLLYAAKNPAQINKISIRDMGKNDHCFLIIHCTNETQFIYDAWSSFYSGNYHQINKEPFLHHMNSLKEARVNFEERIEPYLSHTSLIDIVDFNALLSAIRKKLAPYMPTNSAIYCALNFM